MHQYFIFDTCYYLPKVNYTSNIVGDCEIIDV
jgi:hypothetical protein